MDNDRMLLEKAAKAAGIPESNICLVWNPLTDDGDALRLAVKLGLSIDPNTLGITVGNFRTLYKLACYESITNDPYAATRRAIVRAAAQLGTSVEIGKAMV